MAYNPYQLSGLSGGVQSLTPVGQMSWGPQSSNVWAQNAGWAMPQASTQVPTMGQSQSGTRGGTGVLGYFPIQTGGFPISWGGGGLANPMLNQMSGLNVPGAGATDAAWQSLNQYAQKQMADNKPMDFTSQAGAVNQIAQNNALAWANYLNQQSMAQKMNSIYQMGNQLPTQNVSATYRSTDPWYFPQSRGY